MYLSENGGVFATPALLAKSEQLLPPSRSPCRCPCGSAASPLLAVARRLPVGAPQAARPAGGRTGRPPLAGARLGLLLLANLLQQSQGKGRWTRGAVWGAVRLSTHPARSLPAQTRHSLPALLLRLPEGQESGRRAGARAACGNMAVSHIWLAL